MKTTVSHLGLAPMGGEEVSDFRLQCVELLQENVRFIVDSHSFATRSNTRPAGLRACSASGSKRALSDSAIRARPGSLRPYRRKRGSHLPRAGPTHRADFARVDDHPRDVGIWLDNHRFLGERIDCFLWLIENKFGWF